MMTRTLRRSVERLRRQLPPPASEDDCPAARIGRVLTYFEGDPEPACDGADVPRCPTCGGVHVLVERLVVVPGDAP
jgi:hypothetical protein